MTNCHRDGQAQERVYAVIQGWVERAGKQSLWEVSGLVFCHVRDTHSYRAQSSVVEVPIDYPHFPVTLCVPQRGRCVFGGVFRAFLPCLAYNPEYQTSICKQCPTSVPQSYSHRGFHPSLNYRGLCSLRHRTRDTQNN